MLWLSAQLSVESNMNSQATKAGQGQHLPGCQQASESDSVLMLCISVFDTTGCKQNRSVLAWQLPSTPNTFLSCRRSDNACLTLPQTQRGFGFSRDTPSHQARHRCMPGPA